MTSTFSPQYESNLIYGPMELSQSKDEWVCPKCGSMVGCGFMVKLIPTNRPYLQYFPKYIPQIHRQCRDCHSFLRCEKQTPELMAYLNEKLKGEI